MIVIYDKLMKTSIAARFQYGVGPDVYQCANETEHTATVLNTSLINRTMAFAITYANC